MLVLLENSSLKKRFKRLEFHQGKNGNEQNFYGDLYLKNDTGVIQNIFNVSVSLHKKRRIFRDTERQQIQNWYRKVFS